MSEFSKENTRSLFIYSETGELRWIKRNNNLAGSRCHDGYYQVRIKKKKYMLHRIIYIYHNGTIKGQIDHVNGIRSDNRIENLRDCSPTQNQQNRPINKNNTSGFKGVSKIKGTQRFRATLNFFGKHTLIGIYDSAAEASEAYESKAKELFGEFFREFAQ